MDIPFYTKNRELIMSLASELSTGRAVSPLDSRSFRGYERLTISERESAINRARVVANGLLKWESAESPTTLGSVFGVDESISPAAPDGPLGTSGMTIWVPYEIEVSPGKWSRKRMRINANWDDTIDAIRRKAQDKLHEYNIDSPPKRLAF